MSRLDTRLAQVPRIPGEPARATSTPLYQTATFAQDLEGGENRWDYSRSGNPTRDVLEEQLAALDGAKRALAYGSGIAAVSAVLRLAVPGDEILVGDDLYGGTVRLLREYERHLGLSVRRVDVREPAQVRAALGPRTRLVFVETPTNPRLRLVDVAALAAGLEGHEAKLVVDNSMLSPLRQRPWSSAPMSHCSPRPSSSAGNAPEARSPECRESCPAPDAPPCRPACRSQSGASPRNARRAQSTPAPARRALAPAGSTDSAHPP